MAYTNAELTDMHLMYGLAECNGKLARRLYAERFPKRRLPSSQTFLRLNCRLREYGTLLVNNGKSASSLKRVNRKLRTRDRNRNRSLEIEEIEDSEIEEIEDSETEDRGSEIEDTKPRIEDISTKIEDIDPNIENISPKIEDINPSIEDISTKIEIVCPKIEDIKTEVVEEIAFEFVSVDENIGDNNK